MRNVQYSTILFIFLLRIGFPIFFCTITLLFSTRLRVSDELVGVDRDDPVLVLERARPVPEAPGRGVERHRRLRLERDLLRLATVVLGEALSVPPN